MTAHGDVLTHQGMPITMSLRELVKDGDGPRSLFSIAFDPPEVARIEGRQSALAMMHDAAEAAGILDDVDWDEVERQMQETDDQLTQQGAPIAHVEMCWN